MIPVQAKISIFTTVPPPPSELLTDTLESYGAAPRRDHSSKLPCVNCVQLFVC